MPSIIWSNCQKYCEICDEKFKITDNGIVANTDASNLTTKRLNSLLSKIIDSYVRMLQLGSWNNDPTKYIVVEDVEALAKAFNKISSIRFLSLQGVSGLVEPPSLATMAESLKVLNLKGCHNLESLPPQFNKMLKWELGYLDISECYLLDHLPDALSGCIKLRVLKGFVLPKEQTPDQPFISTPSQFQHLWKLTLRTKRLNFPTKFDLATLCELGSLTHLKITWVGACSGDDNQDGQFEDDSKFPPKLTKFEMEAASDSTSQKILNLIARPKEATANVPDSDTKPPVSLNKLYIKGGNLSKLDQNVDCKILRLQYLPNMQHSCYDMMRTFPTLHRLEMSKDVMYSMLRQSFQKATGTTDENSGWEPSFTRHAVPSSTS
ncbi:disease resistance RPP13-like protein 4 [Silene latifolia]|uniref:disease resistance RPP13-like protein 4 n=1 Tax=Silene latifolia TaxID=37657 RepID=UPI003D78AE02